MSFLGLGVQPPTATWGKELRVGFNYLESAPLFSIVPGLMITLVSHRLQFVGDGLRDALDPRLKGMGLHANDQSVAGPPCRCSACATSPSNS